MSWQRGEHILLNVDDILARQLFFIAATEKSGTTWLQLMLDAHPNVVCRGEGQFASKLAPVLYQALNDYGTFIDGLNSNVFSELQPFPGFDAADQAALVRFAAARLWAKCGVNEDTRAVGEKTPANIRCLPTLRHLFPGCKFVFIVRDGRDVVVSGYAHLRRQHGALGEEPIVNYARRVAKIWTADIERAKTAMAERPDETILVRYEDLHAEPEGPLSDVLSFLGVNSAAERVSDCIAAGRFSRLSGGRERGQENPSSQFRKGIVGDWRAGLPPEARAVVEEEAGAALRSLGYEHDGNWVSAHA